MAETNSTETTKPDLIVGKPTPQNIDELLANIEASGEINGLSPEGRWLARQEINRSSNIIPAHTFPAELTPAQCAELAQAVSIGIREWIKLTGVGIGLFGAYLVTETGVSFVKWTPAEIAGAPPDWQDEMFGDNAAPGLTLPCTPAELVGFVNSSIGLSRFSLPLEFMDCLNFEATLPAALETTDSPRLAPPTKSQRSLVAWKQAMIDAWLEMKKIHGGRNPNASETIRFLRRNDKSGFIDTDSKEKTDVLPWITQRGVRKTVRLHTVESAISELKRKKLIPS